MTTRTRGLTLIELMLAIGLVLVVGALVLPAVFTGLGERTFESGAEVVRNQLLLARAHAQVMRRPVEVTYEDRPPRRPGVRARYFLVDTPDTDRFATDAPEDPDQVIVEGWADRDLPDGLSVTDSAATDTVPGFEMASPLGETAVVRLAVFMPDGSAPLVQTVWIRDEHGRRGVIEVNPWTGLPTFERSAATTEAMDDETEPEQPPDDPPDDPIEDFRPEPPPPPADDAGPAPDDPADMPADMPPDLPEENDPDSDPENEP